LLPGCKKSSRGSGEKTVKEIFMIGLALFQIHRLAINNKIPFLQFINNNFQSGFLIIKCNNQQIIFLIFVFCYAINFFQDRTYPGLGVSSRTAGHD
jgi:hypothetical protein